MENLYQDDSDKIDTSIYTVSEFAELAKTNRRTVMNWIKTGKILAFRLTDSPHSHYRIRGAEIGRLISYELNKKFIIKQHKPPAKFS